MLALNFSGSLEIIETILNGQCWVKVLGIVYRIG